MKINYLIGLVCPEALFGNNLTPIVKRRAEKSLNALGIYLRSMPFVILHSPIDGARGCINLMKNKFDLCPSGMVRSDLLYDSADADRIASAWDLINSNNGEAEVVVVISHPRLLENLAAHSVRVKLGAGVKINASGLRPGDSWLLDLQDSKLQPNLWRRWSF
jgi:hypothetical protein